tara:strand:- start:133 stop:345 length:213 start_codon:yes stop_codon:yes gene_type:complete
MNKKQQELTKVILVKGLYKIVDKLEQRISTLEKVLESHAKCIGELRGKELRIQDLVPLKEKEKPCPTKKQ